MNEITKYEEDEIDLKELWKIIVKKKIFILIFTFIITIIAFIWVMTRTPIYEVKSNIQIGFIEKELIVEPSTLIKILNVIFSVEDKIATKKNFISEVISISANKKIKNFIEIKTQAISNDEALKKNEEVVSFIKKKYKSTINQYILTNKNNIKALEIQISDIYNLKSKNIKRQIKVFKTRNIVKINNKIIFYKTIKIKTLEEKMKFNSSKLKEYIKAVKQIYQNNKETKDLAALTISSLQMVNYQNLILNSQNKIEDLKIEIELINNETIPSLQTKKDKIINDTIRKLEYKLNVDLKNEKIKLEEEILEYKFKNLKHNVQNSVVVGSYIIKNYPIKPKKKLIIVVSFITGLILAIFVVFFLNFISKEEDTYVKAPSLSNNGGGVGIETQS